VIAKTNGKVKPAMVGDIVVGCVLGLNGQRANEARIASFMAGFPDTYVLSLAALIRKHSRFIFVGLQRAGAHREPSVFFGFAGHRRSGGRHPLGLL
jgi:hypothetical protein